MPTNKITTYIVLEQNGKEVARQIVYKPMYPTELAMQSDEPDTSITFYDYFQDLMLDYSRRLTAFDWKAQDNRNKAMERRLNKVIKGANKPK